jgi:dolichol-phosphate mannosyltransferase
MKVSIVIPAHDEEASVGPTVNGIAAALDAAGRDYEIVVVDDASTDATAARVEALAAVNPRIRCLRSPYPTGFGFAVRAGLERFEGDAVAIMMGDGSDDPRDMLRYLELLDEGYECAFGSRFVAGGAVHGYPRVKLVLNRVQPLLAQHFNLTVELPLKAIVRGHSYGIVPIGWTNRRAGESKLGLREMGSRYLFVVLIVFLEHHLARGDYRRPGYRDQSLPRRRPAAGDRGLV